MPKDDCFKIIYVILKELYETMKSGEKVDLENISASRFGINDSYWLDIMCQMLDKGYIRGFKYKETKTGRIVTSMDDVEITLDGIEYLHENSAMKKVMNALKTVKDIAPGL